MKKRKLFMGTALMCGFFSIAFTFDQNGRHWLWSDNKPVAVILIILAVVFGALWFRASKENKAQKQE